jgi:type IV pilus assembly protein PilA
MIGLLATLLVPSLVRARTVSHDRAALAYAHNVYKVAQAYIADSMVNVDSIPSDCNTLLGYVAGEYSIQRQAFITNCSLNAQGSQVVVAYTGGTQSSITLGQ